MKSTFLAVFLFCIVLLSIHCADKYPAQETDIIASAEGCVACHTNADLLKEVATPLPPVNGEAGEG